METHFDMIYENKRTSINFGEYALALANIDYDELQNILVQYLDTFTSLFELSTTLGHIQSTHPDAVEKYSSHGIYPNRIQFELIQEIDSQLYKPLYKFLNNSYLNNHQLHIITLLILNELDHNISVSTFDWQIPHTYIPSILHHKELREHLESILLRKDDFFSTQIQDRLSEKIITTSIAIDSAGHTRIMYHIDDTLSFLLVDLQKYLTNPKTVIQCKNCDRLFYPSSNKNKLYCRLKHQDTKLTCAQIHHQKPTDAFLIESKRARGKQQGFIKNAHAHRDNPKYLYDYDLLDSHYTQWQKDCSSKMEQYRNKNDLDGFKKWIEYHLFTVSRLEALGIRIVTKKNKKVKYTFYKQ